MAVDNSEQIAALRAAIASGSRKVIFRSGGTHREIEYHSLTEMLNALDRLRAEQSSKSRIVWAAF